MHEENNDTTTKPLLNRLEVAEHAIQLLDSGKLPGVRKLLYGARCELRKITDSNLFWADDSTDTELAREISASKQVGVIRSTPDDVSRFHVFYKSELSSVEQLLFAKTLQSFMAVTYAAIGLDMTALIEQKD